MIKNLKPKSEFNRNVLTLFSGTLVAQAIPIAITPILTRLYTPEDFGLLALFVSLSLILGCVVSARYELAILLPEEDEDAVCIAALAILISSGISFSVLCCVTFFNGYITSLLGNEEIGYWLYFIPFAIFLIGLFNTLNFMCTRNKSYSAIAIANIYKAIFLSVIQMSVGFLGWGQGLISGYIASNIFSTSKMFKHASLNLSDLSIIRLKKVAVRYIDFPKFSAPATLANNVSVHMMGVLIPLFYSVKTLGFYSLSQKILGIPFAFVGGSIGQVYFQHSMEEIQSNGDNRNAFFNTSVKLIFLSLIFFIPLYFMVEDLFIFFFGEQWVVSGYYAKILIPFFCVKFISSTMSITLSIYEKQKSELYINAIIFICSAIIILASSSVDDFLYFYAMIMSFLYLLFFFYYAILSRG